MKPERKLSAKNIISADGWHLVRAAVCGGGARLDQGRVRGRDYTYPWFPTIDKEGRAAALRTVSHDSKRVVYRFSGLDPQASYRLRAIYGTDVARTMRTSADGNFLHEVSVPVQKILARTSPIPAAATEDGALEIVIEEVTSVNVIVSGLELWSTVPETDAAAIDRLVACREFTFFADPSSPGDEHRTLYRQVRQEIRDLLFFHPALDFDELLFVKRHWPYLGHQCAHRVGEAQIPGANLCILKGLRPDGEIRSLLPPEQAAKSGIGRPDLSFDAKRVVFPLARPQSSPVRYNSGLGHKGYDPDNPTDSAAYRGGLCKMYDIYEIGIDGAGLRRLTENPTSEDTEPCYLPDGRIAFTSSRDNRMVQCGDWALVFGLYSMNADGDNVRAFTQPQDSEFYPSMLADGRILFTRWDYVMKPYNVIQQLWVVNPDGTRNQLAYGHWYSFSNGPIAMFEARQIPGTQKVVAVGAAHHNTAVGPLMIADLRQNRGEPEGLRNITPEVGYPEMIYEVTDERITKTKPEIPPISNISNATGWYASPWPLSESLFLACYNFGPAGTAPAGYGIYLYDIHGNKELVYRDPAVSCYAPIPLKARPKPFEIPPQTRPADPNAPGRLFVQDVYAGLEGVPRGTVKWLRVCETYPKERHTNPHRVDAGVGSGWDMRGVLGVVPVEADGSVYFEVPSRKMIFLEALDADYLEIRRMRNYLNLQPGETQSCVGCHERPSASPTTNRLPLSQKTPRAIEPPPWGAGPMRFPAVVQPVLDRHCVRCHDGGESTDKAFDLQGGQMVVAPHVGDIDEGPQHTVSTSFLALLPHVKYVKLTGQLGQKLPLEPYAVGSAVSPLMTVLKKGHYEVALNSADWRALAAWIDCNAPYFGSYDDEMLARTRVVSRAD